MSRRVATCDECGERIIFAITRKGKWIPVLEDYADLLEELSGGTLAYRRGIAPTHFRWQCAGAARRPSSPNDPVEAALAVLGLRRDAPAVVIQAAWRALCRVHHPDVGGDVERMKRINAARDVLERTGMLDEERAA